ncbi:hypothetical protein [Actinomadura barringtoniae]|nr:hypothetical protein [Actinomadura barringtoniae]
MREMEGLTAACVQVLDGETYRRRTVDVVEEGVQQATRMPLGQL